MLLQIFVLFCFATVNIVYSKVVENEIHILGNGFNAFSTEGSNDMDRCKSKLKC